jgi:S-DNA-T family DNA segregation ATPase FtsK/SpoIIIE
MDLSEKHLFKFILQKKQQLMELMQMDEAKSQKIDDNSHLEVITENEESKISQTNNNIAIKKREALPEDDTEPAMIIKRNLNLNIINNRDSFAERIINNSNNQSPIQKMREPQNFDKKVDDINPLISVNVPENINCEPVLVDEFFEEELLKAQYEDNSTNNIENFHASDENPNINAEDPIEILERKRQEILNRTNINSNLQVPVAPVRVMDSEIINNHGYGDSNKLSTPVQSRKPDITLTINDTRDIDDTVQPTTCLSTLIHDEEILYIPPTRDLLQSFDDSADVNEEELAENARILQDKLMTFKIEIDNLSITPGPVVTQYEFIPAPGIKVSRIESLSDDIAMALKAKGIRIIAPIPGKGTVGIEIPNKKPSMVSFESIIRSSKFHQSDHKLPLALGKTIGGEVLVADLTKMPHLLIAGSTGSGKSVGINTIIASLIYKKHPSELKFVIIDPKKVELNQYGRLANHFIASSPDIEDLIITAPEDAVIVLKSVCAEMDKRYDILAGVGQRNILDYNRKVKSGAYKEDKSFAHRPMPYIVVIIDELADLMLTASKEVESPIIRIAQLARAVGIHLVVATQRPSVDVITGIIKANFPARLAYLVASKIDSRTILDQSGAEQLLGNGDMLFLPGGSPKPIRIQNSFISTDEVEALCEHIADQEGYSMPYMLPSLLDKNQAKNGISRDDRDPLFEDAARMLIGLQQASVSIIQRRLKVGYARAGKIIDELEDAGVVGAYAGSKAREVIMDSESELEAIL